MKCGWSSLGREVEEGMSVNEEKGSLCCGLFFFFFWSY